MNKVFGPIWDASVNEIKKGYIEIDGLFTCLLCGKKYERGMIYADNGKFFDAEKAVAMHIEDEHQSVFEYLLSLDKRQNGLSDHQSSLLKLFYEGKSDEDIRTEMGIGSSATVRAHRFSLREKERQAKLFVVMLELLKEKNKSDKEAASRIPEDKLNFLQEQKVLNTYFENGKLKTFNLKGKNKKNVIHEISKNFEPDRIYTQNEVNAILQPIFEDYFALRRSLIDYGFMQRKPDGSQYWLAYEHPDKADERKKKEVKQHPVEMKTLGGVYEIRNKINGKVLVVSTPNLKTRYGRFIELQHGGYSNKKLQEEWNQYGEDSFEFIVLESIEPKEGMDMKEELKKLEQKWLENLKPFGEKGYN